MFATPIEPAREPFSGTNKTTGKEWTLRKQRIAFHDTPNQATMDVVQAAQVRALEVLVPVEAQYEVGKTYVVSSKTIYQKDRGVAVGTFILNPID